MTCFSFFTHSERAEASLKLFSFFNLCFLCLNIQTELRRLFFTHSDRTKASVCLDFRTELRRLFSFYSLNTQTELKRLFISLFRHPYLYILTLLSSHPDRTEASLYFLIV